MKENIFDQYVSIVCKRWNISKFELFSKTKKKEFVTARHMLYYLCYIRSISLADIERYMRRNGYEIKHNSISHGITSMTEKISSDHDYASIVKKISNSVFIN